MIECKAIWKIETNLFLLMMAIPGPCLSDVGSHRDQSWAHYCFLYMSMTLQVFIHYHLPYFLQKILMVKTFQIDNSYEQWIIKIVWLDEFQIIVTQF